MIGVAVLGLGRMGRFYAQALGELQPEVEVRALVDPNPLVHAAYADPRAAIARADIDAVVIAAHTSAHAELAIAAAEAGKAIFCEKPLALTLDDTRAVLAAVESAGVPLQVGFMRRFDEAYGRAKAAIDAGTLGRITTFKAVGRDPMCPPLDYAASSGGLILDMAIHDLDLARWLVGSEVHRVWAEGAVLACDGLASVGDIDNAVISLRFASGAIGSVEVSRNARYGYDIRTEVLGSDAAVSIGEIGNGVLTATDTQVDVPHFIRRFGNAYRAQIRHFLHCLRQGESPRPNGEDALAAFEIAHAAARSFKEQRPVELAHV